MDQPEQSFICCSSLCSVVSKGREQVASKNSNLQGSTQRMREQRNRLAYRWCLIPVTMSIIFMLEMVLSHPSSMVESCSSSLLLMHGQIVSRGNSTGLGHINILLDLSSTRDYRILLYMIGIMEKMVGLWDRNSFFFFLIQGVLGL